MVTNSTSTRKAIDRVPRENGEVTRARIIETAGRLFAEKGYAETTNKEISEVSDTNVTGINYHFGSREGLYEAVVREVSAYMLNPEYLACFADDQLTDGEKLEVFIDHKTRFGPDSWQHRLWAREVVAPSSIWFRVANEEAMSKIDTVSCTLSSFTGIPVDEPELQLCLLNIMSPVISLLMISKKLHSKRIPMIDIDPDMVSRSIKNFIFAGIDRIAKDYAERKGSMTHTNEKK